VPAWIPVPQNHPTDCQQQDSKSDWLWDVSEAELMCCGVLM
jgi:hypothetical protein